MCIIFVRGPGFLPYAPWSKGLLLQAIRLAGCAFNPCYSFFFLLNVFEKKLLRGNEKSLRKGEKVWQSIPPRTPAITSEWDYCPHHAIKEGEN